MPLSQTLKKEFVATSGEFVGTFFFLFFAFFGTQVANSAGASTASGPDLEKLLFISLSFGFSLVVNAWVFFRVSGGLFNPAVTLGTVLIGAVSPLRGVFVVITQLIASIAAAGVVKGLLPHHPELRFKVTLTQGMTSTQGLFLEMFLTAELVFTICMLAAEKHKATYLAPVGIGLALFIAELAGVYFTGGALNPARAFGPCVVDRDFPRYHWIYWIGPFLGSLLASGFYFMLKKLDYEEANPGQDKSDDPEEAGHAAERKRSNAGNDSGISRRSNGGGSGHRDRPRSHHDHQHGSGGHSPNHQHGHSPNRRSKEYEMGPYSSGADANGRIIQDRNRGPILGGAAGTGRNDGLVNNGPVNIGGGRAHGAGYQ